MEDCGKAFPYELKPKEFVLATTEEKVGVSTAFVARVEGRSSLGRLGLSVHSTAGYIDPGFAGQITLELTNHTNKTILLYPGMKICQIAFELLVHPSVRYYGHPELNSKYQGQKGAQGSKIHKDFYLDNIQLHENEPERTSWKD